MNILLVSTSSGSRGGGEIFLLYLAMALKDLGHNPLLWCSSHQRMDELAERFSDLGEVYRDDYVNSYLDRRLRVFSAVLDQRTATRLSRRFASIPADVIHLNKQTLEDGLDLLRAIRQAGKPAVCTIHITQSGRSLGTVAGGLRDSLAVKQLNNAIGMSWTGVSDARANELQQMIKGEVHTIYNSVSDYPPPDRRQVREEVCRPRNWPDDSVLVVCVARLVSQKDPARFLRMAISLHRREPRSRFLWIGDGEGRAEFEREAQACGLAGLVDCTGWHKEPRRYLAAADLYLHPAAYEGLPLAILEAMEAALPCVLSPEIAAEVRVFDATNVILAGPSDDGSWLEQAVSAEARRAYSAASRKLYETHFRPGSMASRFLDLYCPKQS